MTKPTVTTRKGPDGKTQYRCPNDGWVSGVDWAGTGFTKLICEGCAWLLDDDPYAMFELENNIYEEEE